MSPQPSSGIVTVLFTDVEASTDLTTRLGDDVAGPLLATYHRLVREQIVAHGGRRLESTGDGFMALFDSTRRAVACALAIQHELGAREDGIRVRIGINAGEVLEGDEALFGAAINLAKRVMDRAGGGEIVVTETVRQLAGTVPEARFRDRHRTTLKGFPERQHLYEVEPTAPRIRPPPRAPERRPRRAAIAGIALLVTVAGAGAVIALGGEEPATVASNSVAVIDAEDGRVVGQVPVGVRPAGIAVGAGSVWVANSADGTVSQIAPKDRRVTSTVTSGAGVGGIGAGPRDLWVAGSESPVLNKVDPTFGDVARTLPLGADGSVFAEDVRAVSATADAVWVEYGDAQVARVDPETARIVARVSVGTKPTGVAIGPDAVWISDERDGTVTRIDPRTNAVAATVPVGEGASGIAAGAGGVWVAVTREDRVKRIDPATNAVADTVRVGGGPAGVAVGAGAVWVTSRRSGEVTRIEPGAARVSRTIDVGHSPQGVSVVGDEVWVAVQDATAPPAGGDRAADVLRVAFPQETFGGTDPPRAAQTNLVYATCALLLNYPDEPFPAGARVQPEVAEEMPTVGDGGRTYTFRLKPGFRFSPPSNAPVTADAFRRAIERGVHPKTESYASVIMADLVGIEAYAEGRAKHVSGVTARGATLTIRLKEPSPTLPARMASSYFCAVPPATPISAGGIDAIPMAGPYYIASYVPERRMVLRRNPNYGGDRPARMRAIDVDLDVSRRRAVTEVEAGRADYTPDVPPDRVPALERDHGPDSAAAHAGGQRYFSGVAAPVTHWFALNRRRPLFAERRMRIAVNYALDRAALARIVFNGGPTPGRATDQFTPPGQPGFRDAAIYSLGRPDVERARQLAGDRRRRAVLITCTFEPCRAQGRVLVRNLAAIGIDLRVRHFPVGQMFTRMQTPGESWDLGYFNWFQDFVDPSQFIEPIWGAPTPENGEFRDRAIQRRIRDAAASLDHAARTKAFEQIDADMARSGAAAPFAHNVSTDFFSARIGCQVQQPVYGISLGALCERE